MFHLGLHCFFYYYYCLLPAFWRLGYKQDSNNHTVKTFKRHRYFMIFENNTSHRVPVNWKLKEMYAVLLHLYLEFVDWNLDLAMWLTVSKVFTRLQRMLILVWIFFDCICPSLSFSFFSLFIASNRYCLHFLMTLYLSLSRLMDSISFSLSDYWHLVLFSIESKQSYWYHLLRCSPRWRRSCKWPKNNKALSSTVFNM